MSAPFRNRKLVLTQPDGTQIEAIGSGNQFRARLETLDGLPIVRNPSTGFYGAASGLDKAAFALSAERADGREWPPPATSVRGFPSLKDRWLTRRQVDSRLAGLSNREFEKLQTQQRVPPRQVTAICVPVHFKGEQPTFSASDIRRFLNARGYNDNGNAGSVRDYFLDVSRGRLDNRSTVTDYFETAQARDHYRTIGAGDPAGYDRAYELVREVGAELVRRGMNFSKFSLNQWDDLLAVNVLYTDEPVGNPGRGLWPHSGYLNPPAALTPPYNVWGYQISNMGKYLSLGSYCHETGHLICDFPDLYDTDDATEVPPPVLSWGVGIYCLMGADIDDDATNPRQPCGYLKHLAGWMDSTILQPGRQRMRADRGRLLIHRKPNNDEEYLVLEHRRNMGRDSILPASGLLVWHVDTKGSNENQEGTPSLHYRCALLQADGRRDLEDNANRGDATDFYPSGGVRTFGPASWWDGTSMGIRLENIVDHGDYVEFDVHFV